MPANKKYLTTSTLQRFLKISAAFMGGYMVSLSFHLLIMRLIDKQDVFMTMKFSVYLIWAVLMIIAFLGKNGWIVWGWYLGLTLIFSVPFIYPVIFK